jgi:excisionase family DNA binding protein
MGETVFIPKREDHIELTDTSLTVKEAADRLKMHPGSVRRLIYEGKLMAFYTDGRRLRMTERHLATFL